MEELTDDWNIIEECGCEPADDDYLKEVDKGFVSISAEEDAEWKRKLVEQKDKVMGALYNMYHNLPTDPPEFSSGGIYVLGEQFCSEGGSESDKKMPAHAVSALDYIRSGIIWFTYRRNFPNILYYEKNSDIGWGCMIRTGQMMLARTLLELFNGRTWKLENSERKQPFSNYRKILRLFSDSPQCPFSIHNIVAENINIHGVNHDDINSGGEWFSPLKICKVVQKLVKYNQRELGGLGVYLARGGNIYIDRVLECCKQSKVLDSDSEEYEYSIDVWQPVLVLVVTRLGVSKINSVYFNHLKHVLRSKYTVGIVGGKPKSSLYFMGYQGRGYIFLLTIDDNVIYLDPHHVQSSVAYDAELTDSTYQCDMPQKMNMSKMDPSLAVGFLFTSKEEFFDFVTSQYDFQATGQHAFFSIEPTSE